MIFENEIILANATKTESLHLCYNDNLELRVSWNMKSENDLTLDYYNKKTTEFFDETVIADVSPLHERFLKYNPEHGRILDFGCGSGRDTKFFKDMGYEVDAIDGSSELAKMATEYSGVEVRCMDFFNLSFM